MHNSSSLEIECWGEIIIIIIFQHISVLLEQFNSILLHDSFVREDCPE